MVPAVIEDGCISQQEEDKQAHYRVHHIQNQQTLQSKLENGSEAADASHAKQRVVSDVFPNVTLSFLSFFDGRQRHLWR